MSISIKCYRCSEELDKPGALIFDPPDAKDECFKMHICRSCWTFLLDWLQ